MIKLERVSKTFGSVIAVDSLSLEIKNGELFGFLGPNGAGKTTTIRMMAGLIKPSSGTIHIDRWNLAEHPRQAKQICGFIPDRPFMYSKLAGREFLRFASRLYNIEPAQAEERVEMLLEMFDATKYADDLIESYSHGMKQRIVMASALIHKPQYIIVDEPMVGLDPQGTRLVKKIFKDLCQQGVSIFMSTHTLEIAEEMCDRIGIIQMGRLIAAGTLQELRAQAGGAENRLESIFFDLTGNSGAEEGREVLKF
jgi:ABC-2 type transport system ATP-binding protein